MFSSTARRIRDMFITTVGQRAQLRLPSSICITVPNPRPIKATPESDGPILGSFPAFKLALSA
jgi:hypothetical protein